MLSWLPDYAVKYRSNNSVESIISDHWMLGGEMSKTIPIGMQIFIILFAISGRAFSQEAHLEQNKELVRRMDAEIWNKGNLEIIDELYSPDFVWHFLPTGSETRGIRGLREEVRNHREAFPDWTEEIKHIVAEEDFVVIHFVSKGTNKGSFMGNPPTGKLVQINEMSIFRIEDGKIVEQWLLPDLLSLNQQLGFISQ